MQYTKRNNTITQLKYLYVNQDRKMSVKDTRSVFTVFPIGKRSVADRQAAQKNILY